MAANRVLFKIVGLTGGIASGKSTVARLLGERGFLVMDADQLVRELSAPGGAAHTAIVQRFGTSDRAKIREIVFKDPSAKKDLEAILHPLVGIESLARAKKMTEHDPGRGPVIYEAALLIETGRTAELDGLIVVTAPIQTRVERLMGREGSAGMTEELARKIISSQLSDAERVPHARWVIDNSGDLAGLESQVEELARKLGSC